MPALFLGMPAEWWCRYDGLWAIGGDFGPRDRRAGSRWGRFTCVFARILSFGLTAGLSFGKRRGERERSREAIRRVCK